MPPVDQPKSKDPHKELEIAVGELEERVDRLRALYEQYFMGYEKLEPTIVRKDVDRRFAFLRKQQIRNTALRFKFNVITQKFQTYSMYWGRICRQIEEGTYKRHVIKAARRFAETDAKKFPEPSIDIDLGDFEESDLEALLAQVDAETAAFERGLVSTDTVPPGMPTTPPPELRAPSPLQNAKPRIVLKKREDAGPGAVTPASPGPIARPLTPANPMPIARPATPAAPGPIARPAMPASPGPIARPLTPANPMPIARPATPASPGPVARPATPAAPGIARPATPASPGPIARPAAPAAPGIARPATPASPGPVARPVTPANPMPIARPATAPAITPAGAGRIATPQSPVTPGAAPSPAAKPAPAPAPTGMQRPAGMPATPASPFSPAAAPGAKPVNAPVANPAAPLRTPATPMTPGGDVQRPVIRRTAPTPDRAKKEP